MDMSLPGMGKLTLCREIAREPALAQTKVLIVTDSMDSNSPPVSFAEGTVEFIPKPFEPEGLRVAAQRLLGTAD
jgi:CheY-like chemotaxis protein